MTFRSRGRLSWLLKRHGFGIDAHKHLPEIFIVVAAVVFSMLLITALDLVFQW